MDEKFPIPAKKPMFGEENREEETVPSPKKDFIKTFVNDAGDKAVNLACYDEDSGGKVGYEELDTYAKELLDGGADSRNLQVGDFFDSEADAKAEAERLSAEYAPAEGADAADIMDAVAAAKDAAGEELPDFGDNEDEEPFDLEEEEPEDEPEEDTEDEPIFGQLKKFGKK